LCSFFVKNQNDCVPLCMGVSVLVFDQGKYYSVVTPQS
jgi:hypothetical protein